MDYWLQLALGVLLLAAVAAWLLRRNANQPVEDFGESRPAAPPPSPAASPGDLVRLLEEAAAREAGCALDPIAIKRISDAAAKAQAELKTASTVEINLPFLTADRTGPKHFVVELTRDSMGRIVLK